MRKTTMLRMTQAFASTLIVLTAHAAPPGAQTQQPKAPHPLSSYPASFDYLSNDAPFVVADVEPRSLDAVSFKKGTKDAVLVFLATDLLRQVNVVTYAKSPEFGTREVAGRIACGSKTPGYYRCTVPMEPALAALRGSHGLFGMRIEAEGMDGERSTVQVTLPVKAGVAPSPVQPKGQQIYSHTLTPVAAPVRPLGVSRPSVPAAR
jgi:hypothetical protein